MSQHPKVNVDIVMLKTNIPAPTYETAGASGFDIRAVIPEPYVLKPGERKLFPSGFKVAVPYGLELQVRPRSGNALKSGISVVNTPGTVDADYRGEVGVILINHGSEDFTINPGDRIAQGVFVPVFQANFIINDTLDETARGEGGFGSTGK
jgi:dUTP pyrophosphatase